MSDKNDVIPEQILKPLSSFEMPSQLVVPVIFGFDSVFDKYGVIDSRPVFYWMIKMTFYF